MSPTRLIVSLVSVMAALSHLAIGQTCAPPPAGMIDWWTGDGTALDRLGDDNGTLQNGATFAPGLVGQAFQLNVPGPTPFYCQTCAYVALADTSAGPLSAVTIEGWVYLATSQGHYQWIYSRTNFGAAPGGSGPELSVDPNVIYWRPNSDPDSGQGVFYLVNPLPVNQWTHIAGTYDSQTGISQIYVNGVQVGSETLSGTIPLSYPGFLGERADQEGYFSGLIDELSLYNRALSAAEIQSIVVAGSAGKCKGAVSSFGIIGMQPTNGGNAGFVTATVYGEGFQTGAQVTLSAAGQQDIVGQNTSITQSIAATTTFNLTGATPGVRNVVITNPDGTVATLTGGFTIEQGGVPQLWAQLSGIQRIRIGAAQPYSINYGNLGSIDALGTRLLIYFPSSVAPNLSFGNANGVVSSVTQGPNTIVTVNVGRVPASSTLLIPITMTVGGNQAPFQVQVNISAH